MKKNVMMRVAAVLLVCVLASTCGISGTFAKYVSEASASDGARVAKWGWGSTSITLDMFDAEYDGTVEAANGTDKLIAPGTSASGTLVWDSGSFKPEVDYVVSYTIEGDIPTILEAELDWTLNIDGVENTYTTFDAMKAALEAKTYNGEANTAAPTFTIIIGWVWVFNGGDDAADTYLGNMDPLAELEVTVTLTATQID